MQMPHPRIHVSQYLQVREAQERTNIFKLRLHKFPVSVAEFAQRRSFKRHINVAPISSKT